MTSLNRTVVVVLLCLLGASCSDGQPNNLKFDSKQWRGATVRERGQMVSDLIRNHNLVGRSRSDVIEILGEGDRNYVRYISYEFESGDFLGKLSVSRMYVIVVLDDSGETVKEVTVADA